jgi:hypothetical protein
MWAWAVRLVISFFQASLVPAHYCIWRLLWYSLYFSAELVELAFLNQLGEMVAEHAVCWTVLKGDFDRSNSVLDEEVSHIFVIGSLAAGLFSICFQYHCTHFILVQD